MDSLTKVQSVPVHTQDKDTYCISPVCAVAAMHGARHEHTTIMLIIMLATLQPGDRANAAVWAGNGCARECGRAPLSHCSVC